MKKDDIRTYWGYFRIGLKNEIYERLQPYEHLPPHSVYFALFVLVFILVGVCIVCLMEILGRADFILCFIVWYVLFGLFVLLFLAIAHNGKIYAEREQKSDNAMQSTHHFKSLLTSAQAKQLLEGLGKYLPDVDQASFDYVFCSNASKLDCFKRLNWTGSLNELSTFIDVFFNEEEKRWAKTVHWFTYTQKGNKKRPAQHGKEIKPKYLATPTSSNEEYFKRLKKSLGL
jgi:Ca2+/Na+ antiporter